MKPMRMVKEFAYRYPNFGAIIWRLTVQYFIIQLIVASAWTLPYSWLHNTISDLGNISCGIHSERFVCSPLHTLMNGSFVALGISMAVGALLIYHEFKKSPPSLAGFMFWAVAGVGTIMVGLFPADDINYLHSAGATLSFFVGNLALLTLGASLNIPKSMRIYTLASGIVAMAALLLFIGKIYLGLGVGGMERLVSYPQTLWLIIFGMYIARQHAKGRLATVNQSR